MMVEYEYGGILCADEVVTRRSNMLYLPGFVISLE